MGNAYLEPDPDRGPRATIGIVLILLALALGGWIVWQLYTVLNAPESFALIMSLVPRDDRLVFESGIQKYEVPAVLLKVFVYFIFLAVMGVAAGIFRALLAGGVRLLRADSGREVAAALDRRLQYIEKAAATAAQESRRAAARE